MGRKSKYNEALIGKQFGDLTILGLSDKKGTHREIRVICKCVCGKIIEPIFSYLHNKRKQKDCGCSISKKITKHGYSRSKLYKTWCGIFYRCTNPKNKSFKYYGKRGINICKDWEDFTKFRNDMFPKLIKCTIKYGNNKKLTIERIDNNKNYCKENCTFIPKSDQNKNKRNVQPIKAINIKTKEVIIEKNQTEMAKKIGTTMSNVNNCLCGKSKSARGWKFERLTKERRIK